METKETLQKKITDVFDNFNTLFEKIEPELINAEPKVGSWTIGQLGQHVALATMGLPDKKNKPADRPTDQFEQSIKETFLDHSQKFESPEFIAPLKKKYDQKSILVVLESNKELLLRIIKEEQLDHLCLGTELPGWGHLTRYEWIKLIIYHLQRHIQQLQKLKQSFYVAEQLN